MKNHLISLELKYIWSKLSKDTEFSENIFVFKNFLYKKKGLTEGQDANVLLFFSMARISA